MVRTSKPIMVAVTAVATLLVSGNSPISDTTARAQAKATPKPACNLRAFPLVPGAEWVYEARELPGLPKPKQPRPKPRQPEKVIIKVLSVATEDKVTSIELEENLGYRTYKTVLTCERDKLNVPPESIYFSGEPGGGLNIELGEIERTGNTYMFRAGQVRIPEWTEEVKTTFTRKPVDGTGAQMVNGTLDLQRVVLIGLPEDVATDLGQYKATPVQVDMRGSVNIETKPDPYLFNVPANTISKLWFADDVGVVQIANSNLHFYQLTQYTPAGAPETP
ncbi:MAG: hypothetical protein MJE77_10505 [Proteobacteria bacterium]|nr:hypothetical protein [Pseudomonadota bacterium]